MRLIQRAVFLALAALLPLSAWATPEQEAMSALDAANAKVLGLSAIKSPSISNISTVKGELEALQPFFDKVAQTLGQVPVDSSTRLLSLGGSISAKLDTAGQISTVNIALLIESCRGIVADLDAWKALLPEVRRGLQQRVDQQTQALIRDQVNQTFPTPIGGPVGVPNSVPTATPQVWPTATTVPTLPPVAATATPIALPPVDGGGVIPGPPTVVPTSVPADQPTPVPTPRPALKLPVAVAAGHNNQTVWVANVQGNSVGVMDAKSRRFIAQIPVGSRPVSLALDGGDGTLVVANSASASVSLIDARANSVRATLSVGAGPMQVLVTHGGKAYVACQEGKRVDVIDLQRSLLVKTITLSSRPGRMDQPNSSQNVYVSLPDEDALAVIDTAIDEVVATVAE